MQLAPQPEQSFPIVSIKPLAYSPLKLVSIVLSLSAISVALILLWHQLAIVLLLALPFLFAYLKITNHRALLTLLYDIEEYSEDIHQYAVYDLSFNANQEANRKANKIFIVNIHFTKDKTKYFYFKEELYQIHQSIVSKVNQLDIIKALQIDYFQRYVYEGLNIDRQRLSQQLFGRQKKYIHSNLKNFIIRRLYGQKQWLLLNTYLTILSFIFASTIATPILAVLINMALLGLIAYDENKKVLVFKDKFSFIGQKKFNVFRQGQTQQASFDQIMVGDIMQFDTTQQFESLVYFKSLLIGNFQIICKEGENKEQIIKRPIRTIGDLNEDRRNRHVIKPLSFVEKASLRGNEHLIVLDHNYITKFFNLWFNKDYYSEFQSIFHKNAIKTIILYASATSILIVFFLVVSLIINHDITSPFKQTIIGAIIPGVMILPSIMHLLLCLNHSKGQREVQKSDITMLGGDLSSAGSISNIAFNFQQLLQIQFQQILYKNLIFDPSSRPFEPDSATIESGRTYESLLALIIYISLGYLDEEENKPTFLRQIYKLYQEYFALEDSLFEYKDIVHKSSKKVWRLVHKDFQNEEGTRSWRIEYENQLKYIITECNVRDQKIIAKYISNQDRNKLQDYNEIANNLLEEGKKIKLVLFKNFRKEYAIRGTELSGQSQGEFKSMQRQSLEKNLQFAAFIIFDNALTSEKLNILQTIKQARDEKQKLFNLLIYSRNKTQNLAGFEHILDNIPIYHSRKNNDIALLVRDNMQANGLAILMQDIEDQYAGLMADISIKIEGGQRSNHHILQFITPSDVYLRSMAEIKELLEVGHFNLKFRLQVIKYGFMVAFWGIFGLLWVGVHAKANIEYSQLWTVFTYIFLILLPLALKNQLFYSKTLVNYKGSASIYTITFITQILLNIFISIFILIFISQFDLCSQSLSQQPTHNLSLRTHLQENTTSKCMNIPLILSGSASFVCFAVFYEDAEVTKFQIWKFLIVPLWLVLMGIAQLPAKIILFCLGIIIFEVLTKVFIRLAGRQSKEQSNTSK